MIIQISLGGVPSTFQIVHQYSSGNKHNTKTMLQDYETSCPFLQYFFAFRMSLQNFALGIYPMPEFLLLFCWSIGTADRCTMLCARHLYVWDGWLFHEPIRAIHLIVVRGFSKSAWWIISSLIRHFSLDGKRWCLLRHFSYRHERMKGVFKIFRSSRGSVCFVCLFVFVVFVCYIIFCCCFCCCFCFCFCFCCCCCCCRGLVCISWGFHQKLSQAELKHLCKASVFCLRVADGLPQADWSCTVAFGVGTGCVTSQNCQLKMMKVKDGMQQKPCKRYGPPKNWQSFKNC